MLRLKNIRIEGKIAEADFYPEDRDKFGHIKVDLSTNEIISCDEVPGFGDSYSGHARQRLARMAKENEQREECLMMWY